MQPRLVLRTHYQVDEPALLKPLVQKCSSAVKSVYPERAALCLANEIKRSGREFNPAAGSYAVDLARQLRLINDNVVWTELGQVLNLISEDHGSQWDADLSLSERILFFRLFLEADGAAMLLIARTLRENGQLPPAGKSWCDVANEMVISVYMEYLEHTADPADRVRIRRVVDRRRASPYKGKSGPHQMFVHVQALHRMGLLEREDSNGTRVYRIGGAPSVLDKLLAALPNVLALEACVSGRDWANVVAQVLADQLPSKNVSAAVIEDERILEGVRSVYDSIVGTGVSLCAIQSIVETLQIRSLAAGNGILGYSEVLSALERLRKRFPRDVRFHVDRAGRPAFIKLSAKLAS